MMETNNTGLPKFTQWQQAAVRIGQHDMDFACNASDEDWEYADVVRMAMRDALLTVFDLDENVTSLHCQLALCALIQDPACRMGAHYD